MKYLESSYLGLAEVYDEVTSLKLLGTHLISTNIQDEHEVSGAALVILLSSLERIADRLAVLMSDSEKEYLRA